MEKHKAGTSILKAVVAPINLGLQTLIKLNQSNKRIMEFSESISAFIILRDANSESLHIDLPQTKENPKLLWKSRLCYQISIYQVI